MRHTRTAVRAVAIAAALAAPLAPRAQQMPNPYGPSVGLEAARKVAAAAVAEARRTAGLNVAVAVVDTSGLLVYFERMDAVQTGSIHVAQEKARSAAQFKRPTKAFEELANSGKANILGLPGAIPLEGGVPLLVDGKIVGAVGVSGGTSPQDGVCAKAAAETLEPKKP